MEMDKEKILEWALELIKMYEADEDQLIEEMGDASERSHLLNKECCDDLRDEIKDLLGFN